MGATHDCRFRFRGIPALLKVRLIALNEPGFCELSYGHTELHSFTNTFAGHHSISASSILVLPSLSISIAVPFLYDGEEYQA